MLRIFLFLMYCSFALSGSYKEDGFDWVEHLFTQHRFSEFEQLIGPHPEIVHEAIRRNNFAMVQHIAHNIAGMWRIMPINGRTPLEYAGHLGRTRIVETLRLRTNLPAWSQ